MKKDNQSFNKTDVIFRKWKNGDGIIAIFPHEINDSSGNVLSYEHVGQHGGADYSSVMKNTTKALEKEYQALKSELIRIGYQLRICQRQVAKKYYQALVESRKTQTA